MFGISCVDLGGVRFTGAGEHHSIVDLPPTMAAMRSIPDLGQIFFGTKRHRGELAQECFEDVPWEFGPSGKQTVRGVSIDPSSDSITLECEGEGEGDSVNGIKKLPLVKDKKTYALEVAAGRAKWCGYATFRRGVILSDVLFVQRTVTVTSKELGQSSGTERRYSLLLNSAPPNPLHS